MFVLFTKGFFWETPEKLPSSLHTSFSSAFSTLNQSNLFQYDAVQPGRKKLSRTFVTRTLVGNPGSTYRYLGLRLFSHPWCDVDANGNQYNENYITTHEDDESKRKASKRDFNSSKIIIREGSSLIHLGYERSTVDGLLSIGKINSFLIQRSNKILQNQIEDSVPEKLVGSADYSLTLINKMEPSSIKKDFKHENIYGMGKASVSWHMDSGLQDFSTIAVYHELQDMHGSPSIMKHHGKTDVEPWKVALRISGDEHRKKSPPLTVPLPSGALYYMLDDFNHKHEHAVLAGAETLRYSSTHRVAREGNGTWQYIRDKCNTVLDQTTSIYSQDHINTVKRKAFVKEVRKHQKLFIEIEFEWIRQWLIQGRLHADLHPYWHAPIQTLKNHYAELEQYSVKILNLLKESSDKNNDLPKTNTLTSEELYDVMIEEISEKIKLRKEWKMRMKDPLFGSMDPSMILSIFIS